MSVQVCQYCGLGHVGYCPRIKRVSYQSNGSIAEVEFHPPTPWPQPSQPTIPSSITEPLAEFLKWFDREMMNKKKPSA